MKAGKETNAEGRQRAELFLLYSDEHDDVADEGGDGGDGDGEVEKEEEVGDSGENSHSSLSGEPYHRIIGSRAKRDARSGHPDSGL